MLLLSIPILRAMINSSNKLRTLIEAMSDYTIVFGQLLETLTWAWKAKEDTG